MDQDLGTFLQANSGAAHKEMGECNGQGSLNILLENASKMIELLKFKQNY